MEELWNEYTLYSMITDQQISESSYTPSTAWRVEYYREYKLQAEDVISQEFD